MQRCVSPSCLTVGVYLRVHALRILNGEFEYVFWEMVFSGCVIRGSETRWRALQNQLSSTVGSTAPSQHGLGRLIKVSKMHV